MLLSNTAFLYLVRATLKNRARHLQNYGTQPHAVQSLLIVRGTENLNWGIGKLVKKQFSINGILHLS